MQVFGRMLKLKSTGLKKSSCNIKHEGYHAKILNNNFFREERKKLCFKHRKLLYLDLPMYPLKDTRFFCPRLLHVSMSGATFLVNDVSMFTRIRDNKDSFATFDCVDSAP